MKDSFRMLGIVTVLVLFLSLFPVCGSNANEAMVSYPVDELAMTIDIPSTVSVVTKGIKQNDPVFADGTFDYIETMSIVRENSDYLLGRDVINNYEIEVIMTSDNNDGISDLKSATAKKQESLLNSISENEGTIACTLYKNKNNVYIETLSKGFVNGTLCYSNEYLTIIDKQNIIVKLSSYGDQLSDGEVALLKTIVDGIEFEQSNSFAVFASLKTGVIVPFALLVIGFVVLAVIKIIKLLSPDDESSELNDEEDVQSLINDKEEDELILNMLSTDKEIEDRRIEQSKLNDESESTAAESEPVPSEEDTIDSQIPVETAESNIPVAEDDAETDDTLIDTDCPKQIEAEESEKGESESPETEPTAETSNENVNEDLEEDNYDDVDIAAAIALFEDNYETRKARREQFREKNKKKSRFDFFK